VLAYAAIVRANSLNSKSLGFAGSLAMPKSSFTGCNKKEPTNKKLTRKSYEI
jgi:hypothetical protein